MSAAERLAIATASLYADAQYAPLYPAAPGSTVEQRAEFAKLVEALAGGVAA